MSTDSEDEDYEYDIAMSFAGTHRPYVEAVVRGLGEDVRVFYDDDEPATLLGEDLQEFFTDLYQHRAKYVAMFVSAEYKTRKWGILERKSALSGAMERRGAYVLPILMDDTQLPGLLPTIGHIDTRKYGQHGVIKILREKIELGRPPPEYVGRVPATQADVDLLLATRPDYWEYWLYAGTLRLAMDEAESAYRDYTIGYAPVSEGHHDGRDAYDYLRAALDRALVLVSNFNQVLSPEVQLAMWGPPGEPGDPALIMHVAKRLIDVYRSFMGEAARFRGAAMPEEFAQAREGAARIGEHPIEQIREFVRDFADRMDRLPDEVAARSDGDDPLGVEMRVQITVSDAAERLFIEGMNRAADYLLGEGGHASS